MFFIVTTPVIITVTSGDCVCLNVSRSWQQGRSPVFLYCKCFYAYHRILRGMNYASVPGFRSMSISNGKRLQMDGGASSVDHLSLESAFASCLGGTRLSVLSGLLSPCTAQVSSVLVVAKVVWCAGQLTSRVLRGYIDDLQALHALGWLHGDIAPAHLGIEANFLEANIIDLGECRLVGAPVTCTDVGKHRQDHAQAVLFVSLALLCCVQI